METRRYLPVGFNNYCNHSPQQELLCSKDLTAKMPRERYGTMNYDKVEVFLVEAKPWCCISRPKNGLPNDPSLSKSSFNPGTVDGSMPAARSIPQTLACSVPVC